MRARLRARSTPRPGRSSSKTPRGTLSTISTSASNERSTAVIPLLRTFIRSAIGTSSDRGKYRPSRLLPSDGNVTQSTPGGMGNAAASRTPESSRMTGDSPRAQSARATRRLRLIWPRPCVSCEYRAILGRRRASSIDPSRREVSLKPVGFDSSNRGRRVTLSRSSHSSIKDWVNGRRSGNSVLR